jgi:hypothetical protein
LNQGSTKKIAPGHCRCGQTRREEMRPVPKLRSKK